MSRSGPMSDVRPLGPDEWSTLRDIRLAALRDSPNLFLSTYEKEKRYDEARWRAEFSRGCWNVCFLEDGPMGLLGATRDPDSPVDTRYLEYLWVAPRSRRHGVARHMLKIVLDRLRVAGVRTALLWVLDGNDVAIHVYERAGFIRTNHSQPLKERPGRTEERLRMDLA
jgi:ribosomal protein S18 acetylase RimI-like enzyme